MTIVMKRVYGGPMTYDVSTLDAMTIFLVWNKLLYYELHVSLLLKKGFAFIETYYAMETFLYLWGYICPIYIGAGFVVIAFQPWIPGTLEILWCSPVTSMSECDHSKIWGSLISGKQFGLFQMGAKCWFIITPESGVGLFYLHIDSWK